MAIKSGNIKVTLPDLEGAFEEEVNKELKSISTKVGRSLATQAKTKHRYNHRTRTLRNATRWHGSLSTPKRGASKGITLKVDETKAKYAKFIIGGFKHRGGSVWTPDPFIDNALKIKEQPIKAQIFWAIQRAIKKVNR